MKNNEINLFELDELPRYVEIAYKKLKNSIFFDKSNVITRNDLVEFEYGDQWENKLKDLAASLTDSAKWESKVKEILEAINIFTLPKTINNITDKEKNKVIFNKNYNEKINIKDFQYMIDMPIEGHILAFCGFYLLVAILMKMKRCISILMAIDCAGVCLRRVKNLHIIQECLSLIFLNIRLGVIMV